MRHLLVLLALAAVVGGCGSSSHHSESTTTRPTTAEALPPPAEVLTRIYLLRAGKVAPVARAVPDTGAFAFATLEQLFAGPTPHERSQGLTTAIPRSASPGAITIVDHVAHIDVRQLSHPALAQVVYTLTELPAVRAVRATRSIGDTKPLARSDFEDVTPAILVEAPLPDEPVTSPLRVSGTANTFEATFLLELRDASGAKLAHQVVTATSGSGQRGTFTATLHFTGTPAVLVVWEPSAENGISPLHEVRIPVRAG